MENKTYIEIKSVGPIKDVKIFLNKINLFIGPQSSGKSTIAKVISFCYWLEKNALMNQGIQHIGKTFFENKLIVFHKMSSYFSEDSYLKYEGEAIRFEYTTESFNIEKTENFGQLKVGKIAYIPSERNIISLPGISSLPLPENNIRSFLFDWLNIHNKYTKENAVPLFDLKMKYYFQESSNKDIIVLENNKEISLDEASSGVQSVVPLYVYLYYYTKWIYDNEEDISFEKKERIEKALIKRFMDETTVHLGLKNNFTDETYDKFYKADFAKEVRDTLINRIYNDSDKLLSEVRDNISRPHFSNIIIEEPEQNLFPQTQVTLMYDILKNINKDRDSLVITTHSPYILYALNNCMLGWIVRENVPEEDEECMAQKDSWINPENVSVWEIKDGKFTPYMDSENGTIQDKNGLIRNNYFDRIMKNVMADFNSLIGYWDD
ncbi:MULTISPECIES: AAA family ATPase [Bacteroides]|uniref:AAA family ATPase n=1 Tax=Bacteroides TaxID=816 RepID=UPI00195A2E86|nr:MULTISPECIES: AAA family ATPase [Bacteroides]MBM6891180.1 AAA family ATPase [Bacteroides caecigallinarum]MCR8894648.1 AAA family ATPase [Bacteroides sp. ET336]MDN0059144.1 AAA family ATPase [Bacteroides caecigallinarum]